VKRGLTTPAPSETLPAVPPDFRGLPLLFVALCLDKPDSVPLRLSTRDAHLAFLAENAAQVKLGGPFLDTGEKPIGSMLIVEAADAAGAAALLARDPYALAGLFASVEVRPWRRVVGAEL
jgi:uncharacterized protein YciI